MCKISGWGKTYLDKIDENGKVLSSVQTVLSGGNKWDGLVVANIPILPTAQCKYTSNWPYIPDKHLCAGYSDEFTKTDACQGDSGGPLICDSSYSSGVQFAQLGVISFGFNCGGTKPGGYTRISQYLDWIAGVAGSVQMIDS